MSDLTFVFIIIKFGCRVRYRFSLYQIQNNIFNYPFLRLKQKLVFGLKHLNFIINLFILFFKYGCFNYDNYSLFFRSMQPALSNCGLIRSCEKQLEIAAYCDAPEPFQLGTQDPGTENMEWLINLHNYVMADLIIVLVVIIGLLTGLFTQKHGITLNFTKTKAIFSSNRIFSHSKFLEIFWTVLPAFTLLVIASPTFNLLYALDDLADPGLILKITAHQWYWSYEYALSLNDIINFDAYLIKTEDLNFGSLRLLETTERLKLPYSTHVRLLITSADVLHSWTIPSFGIKVDACPGRLTQASIFIKRAGLYFGQCSEICGVNHGFMPIVVKSLNPSSIFASDSIEPTPAELPLGVEGHTNAFFIATHTSTQ